LHFFNEYLNFSGATPGPSSEDSAHKGDRQTRSDSVKRSFLQMMMGSRSEGKFKSILSPIYENYEMRAKRAHIDNRGARRLFSSNTEIATSSNTDYDSDEPSTSQSTSASRNDEIPFSPTSNLPNFVMDGTAPHLLEISPQKYKENVDWLTKIRKEKFEQKKTVSYPSPKTQVTPRSKRSRSIEPQKVTKPVKSTAHSLLDFFNKVANKQCENSCENSENNDIMPSSNSETKQYREEER